MHDSIDVGYTTAVHPTTTPSRISIYSTRAPALTLWALHVFILLFTCVQALEEAARSSKKDTP